MLLVTAYNVLGYPVEQIEAAMNRLAELLHVIGPAFVKAMTEEDEIEVDDVSSPVTAEKGEECSICQNDMTDAVALNVCNHRFCSECLRSWVEQGVGANRCCPMCRRKMG
jgi:NADH pyrophosphatase NudC (nudix superfamily)